MIKQFMRGFNKTLVICLCASGMFVLSAGVTNADVRNVIRNQPQQQAKVFSAAGWCGSQVDLMAQRSVSGEVSEDRVKVGVRAGQKGHISASDKSKVEQPKVVSEKKVVVEAWEAEEKLHQLYLTTLKEELERNLRYLQEQPAPKVYSMRYRMRIMREIHISASDGDIVGMRNTSEYPSKMIDVDVRVGSHKFDQTGPDGQDWNINRTLLPAQQMCPRELTPQILQKMLWRSTDHQYRVAAAQYWRKSYVHSIKPKITDQAGDFSKEPPTIYMAPIEPKFVLDAKKWQGILQRVTAQTKNDANVVQSGATLYGWEEVILGVSNDGSWVRQRQFGYSWSLNMAYIGENKELINTSDSGYARFPHELPSEEQLQQKYRDMWKNLKETIDSPEADPDSGPVIVDPALAGAMFYDILMVRLSTGRFLRENDERTFANKLGEQIIPTFLTVVDDPLMQYWQHTFLSGSYPYDDEWVPARRLVMVKDGVLQNFYFSRKPYKDTNRSNGHGRASFFQSPISRPGITLVHSQRSYDLPKLRDMLNQEIKRQGKRYGYILKEFTGTSQVQRSIYSVTPKDIYRLDIKTDRIERVKGLQVRTSASQVLQGIIATGNDYTAFNGSDSEDSGNAQISTVAPSLLINRLVFQRVNIPQKKTFTLPPPFRPVQSPPQPSTAKP